MQLSFLLLFTIAPLHQAADVVDDSPLSSYEILLRLYDSTRGTRWTNHAGWLSTDDVCTWYGISCYGGGDERTGQVSDIDLSGNHLVGTFPSELFTLPMLTSLKLDDNPDLAIAFGEAAGASIQELSLTNSHVVSLRGIGAATNLESLRLVRSQLKGTVPEELFALTKLTALYLNANSFTGTLPTLIGLLTRMEQAFLSNNMLEGSLPSELGMLVNLQNIELSQNAFNGSLPVQLNACTSLERLVVDSQRSAGDGADAGITGTLPALDQAAMLVEVSLQNNRLTGTIPSTFLDAAPKDQIVKIDLGNNQLTGAVPSSWAAFSRLRPYLQDNHISSVSTNLCHVAGQWLDSGPCPDTILCSPGSYSSTGRASSTETCQPCDTAQFYGSTICLNMVNENGTDATTPKSQRDILELMFQQTGGRDWTHADNWMVSDDVCTWYGIFCNDKGKVEGIRMKNNGLSHTFPTEIYSLPALTRLNLNSNPVTFSFKGIAKATNLQTLDVSNTNIASLESLEELNLTPIDTLKLASNNLHGKISSSLFQLKHLREINLSFNQFTGQLGPEVAEWKLLERFLIYGSHLQGPLPTELGLLTNLVLLDLSENSFTGSLPTELENLTFLRSLSIHQTASVNGLTGKLLPFPNLSRLTSLHLEGNHLTGVLPPTFLANTAQGGNRVEVQLADNSIRGVAPYEWAARFDDLFIDLTGNKIAGLHGTWCSKQDWMDGLVSEFDCDAILCPPGTYNTYGRQQNADSICTPCSGGSNLMGVRECAASGTGNEVTSSSAIELKELYYATGGASWSNSTGWNHLADYCNGWFGVFCDSDGEVVKIDLRENSLTGRLPSSIFKLPALKELYLQDNEELECSFDGINQASTLEILWLDNVGLQSISGISAAPVLKEVHLDNNDLTGTIPSELFELRQLTHLSLSYNKLTGRLPYDMALMSNLEVVRLVSNHISGQIPASIGDLKQLRVLSLAENHLTGTLPDELNDLWRLESLELERASGVPTFGAGVDSPGLLGGGLRGPLLSFRNSPRLVALLLDGNSLTGTIPFDLLDGVEDKSQLIVVNVAGNELQGRLPASLTQFSKMNFFASGNKITDIAPGLCKKENWMNGLVKNYGCDAILCPPFTFNEFGLEIADLTSEFPCRACNIPGAATYYGSTSCLTVTEVVTFNERESLKEFFAATNGMNWKVNTNWLDDTSSICTWFGITCVSDYDESVEMLLLPDNDLNGTVPLSLFNLTKLKQIDFSNNNVNIDFDNVEGATSLTYLNLDSTGTESLSGIARAAPGLELLHINGNAFSMLPEEIFKLTSLEALFMSDNDFTGSFPADMSLLGNLMFLACDDCGFEGTLPASIGTMSSLERISLSENAMTGTIPSAISKLSNLKFLDLSLQTLSGGTGFTGTLPDFAGLPSILNIMLASNSLNGSIPTTLLRDVNATEFIVLDLGNNLLTGSIPSEMARFIHVEITLSNNMIDEIPQSICNRSWNQKANHSDCSHILCAKGSYSALGYALRAEPCTACSDPKALAYFGSTTCGENFDKDILSRLYADLNGKSWTNNDGWLIEDDVCDWYGITCLTEGPNMGRVQEIALAGNNLVGTVSNSIYNLQYLENIELRQNMLSLPFEGIGNATNLISLYLSETPVTSLVGIDAADLAYLHLTSCNISGSLPSELFNMTSLRGLYLNYNSFDGSLPTAIQQLTELRELYMFHNKISGPIPIEIGKLSKLEILGLGGNQLTGAIPTELNQLSSMHTLSFQEEVGLSVVGRSDLDTELDIGLSGTLPAFDGLPSLKELYLGKNSLEGTIPDNFLSGISNSSQTVKVDLSNNKIVGSIPTVLTRLDDLHLFLAGNKIEQVSQEVCNKLYWMDGLMKSGCDALLCEPGTYNTIGRRIGNNPCLPCAYNASSFYYGSQTCIPQAGDELDERSILFQFYHSLDGNNWKKRDNWVEDNRPICSWHGVHCASEDSADGNETVVRLELPSNGLKGTIPEVVYHLSSLQVLNLRGNDISLGFHGAEYAKSLEELFLDATTMTSMMGIGKITTLKILHLEDNDFGGEVLPDDLFDLSNLELLDLANSGLGGTLPDKIGSLTRLRQLFCQENDLSGTLPTSIGQLSRLQMLDLSENMFVGTLPAEMADMTSLDSIFLDSFTRNGAGLTGPLLSFSTMPGLRNLFLGSNTLTGVIPFNFLAGITDIGETINIGLKGNSLTGTVPGELARLKRVNIDLAENLIDVIDDSLCEKDYWMDGAVDNFGCNAIMCPVGSYNENGRQTSDEDPCLPCTSNSTVGFMGSTACLALQKKREKQILTLFYQATGGKEWDEKEGWLDDSIDYCDWHGISCKEDMTVESILLGANNLNGRPPKELFDLKNLHFLWLYGNPIDFRFDGIERAKKLTSLLLDSTSLNSIKGIGRALSLSDVDIRFNSLTGTMPTEVQNLRELQSFTAGHNQFSGTVPSFSKNRKLKTLRLGDNQFTGTVPDFSSHDLLQSLDLSDNRLIGTVPGTLLQSVKPETKISVDLSSNQITGTLPGEITKHHSALSIYLHDNKVEGIDPALCSAVTYNNGDVENFGCDAILCPVGTYVEGTGRASHETGPCIPCPEAQYFGSSTCGEASSAPIPLRLLWLTTIGLFATALLLL